MDPEHRPAHSCKHCQRIVLRAENVLNSCRLELPHSGLDVWEAMKDRCEIFLPLFQRSFSGPYDEVEKKRALENAVHDRFPWALKTYSLLEKRRIVLKARLWMGRFHIEIHKTRAVFALYLQYEGIRMSDFGTEIRAHPGAASNELCGYVKETRISSLSSESSLKAAQKWLSTCHSDHTLCPKVSSGNFVPRRLLEIEFDNEHITARLVESLPGSLTRWAALSYVWGGNQVLKTTVSSLSKMNKPFAIRGFPQTIQDAFTVCMMIGLQYLWIDCLCIVQDDEGDIASELATLPQIYQQAWVTISASTADHVSTGFLYDRGHRTEPGELLTSLSYMCKDNVSSGTVIVSTGFRDYVDPTSEYTYRQLDLPIHRRGWTYQERRLSVRLLDFNNENMTFICRTGKFCQGGDSLLWATPGSHNWREQQDSIPCVLSQELPEWHTIVSRYASRKLTFPGDKLKAIGALADMYRSKTEKTYLAGLWRESLIDDLCWKIETPSSSTFQGFSFGTRWEPRPLQYRAPSWSWAAVEVSRSSRIVFLTTLHTTTQATISDVGLQQKPPNTTYGQVYSGYLTVRGLALSTTWRYNNLSTSRSIAAPVYFITTTRDASETDWTDEHDAQVYVTALILKGGISMDAHASGLDSVFGLLLVDAAADTHRRVGTFQLSYRFDGFPKDFRVQTLTIV